MMLLIWARFAVSAEPTIEELLRATDDVARGDSSQATVEMQVKTARYERSMKMEMISQGTEKSLIRILEPAKDAGIATLKLDDNLWNYLPKVDRTMKVPAGMMSGSWMGSHFTNDDLVRESRLSEDYTFAFEKKPENGAGDYVIACTPKPDAPVVWGKVVVAVTPEQVPVKIDYYDEKQRLVRTMEFSDVQKVDGMLQPMRFRIVPHDKPGEFTELRYSGLSFDAGLSDDLFTLQALKK